MKTEVLKTNLTMICF